jgi:hypothetical protein
VSEYLALYLRTTWKEYFNPDVYADIARVVASLATAVRG